MKRVRKGKKGKEALCILLASVMIFSMVPSFAEGPKQVSASTEEASEASDSDSQYWKVVPYSDVSAFRSGDSKDYTAEQIEGYVFAGWFKEASCDKTTALTKEDREGPAYAKYVPEEILGLKAQVSGKLWDSDITNDETGAIRFVTSVDSLDYTRVGFIICLGENGRENDKNSSMVYRTLLAKIGEEANDTVEYTPSRLFHSASQYFKAWTVTNIGTNNYATEFYVTPYWETLDGTIVRSSASIRTVNQGRTWSYVFVDDKGDDDTGVGTVEKPYQTLEKALSVMQENKEFQIANKVENGETGENMDITMTGTVYVKSSLTAGEDFAWNSHNLDVVITGKTPGNEEGTENATVDFSGVTDLNMGDAATFADMNLKFPKATIYANGHRLKIAESVAAITANVDDPIRVFGGSNGETVENTHVELYTGAYKRVYGGGENSGGNVTGDTYVYVGGNVNNDVLTNNESDLHNTNKQDPTKDFYYVFGGGYESTVKGDTHVTMGGNAIVRNVRGGGNSTNERVEGTCYVDFTDNAVAYGVNGGGAKGSVNNTYVVVSGGTIYQLFGGMTSSGGTVNNTSVQVLGGTIKRRIFGGSYNDYALVWKSNNAVAGYSSVSIGNEANLELNVDSDNSLCAISRLGEDVESEIGVLILNSSKTDVKTGWSGLSSNVLYTNYLVKVENGGAVTSEGKVLRITPDNGTAYATVKAENGDVLFQCQGEGTCPLSLLGKKTTAVQNVTVTFSNNGDVSGKFELSYGENSHSYFESLAAAMAAVSTPSSAEKKTATITVKEAENNEIIVSEACSLADGKNVILKNGTGETVTIKRKAADGTEAFTGAMFTVDSGCFLNIQGDTKNDGFVMDGGSSFTTSEDGVVAEAAMIVNNGTLVTGSQVALQKANNGYGASGNGGALYNTGTAEIRGDVTGNRAYNGGAIYNAGGDITISGDVTGNAASNQGGAIYHSDGTVNLKADEQATTANNVSGAEGGAIYIYRGILNADKYLFKSNRSTHTNNNNNRGGAIYIRELAKANLVDCSFGEEGEGNSSAYGGAVFVGGALTADSCTFQYNTSKTSGGAIGIYENNTNIDAEAAIANSVFIKNEATAYGGAIDVNGGGNGVNGTDNIQIQGCSFQENSNKSGGTVSVRTYGRNIHVSNLTFAGDVKGNTDVIYLATANNSIGVSGKISKTEIQIAADAATPQVLIDGYLDAESDITLTPKIYSREEFAVGKMNESLLQATYEKALGMIKVTQPTSETHPSWYLKSTGYLSNAVAKINGEEKSYQEVLEAIGGETETITIQFLRDLTITDTIVIPSGKNVTVTNEAGKNVSLTRGFVDSLFTVEAEGTLTIGSAGEAKTITLDGGNTEAQPLTAASLVSNAGTFTLEANAVMQNANVGSTTSSLGGALNNAANATAIIRGSIRGCSAYNGGAIYNYAGGMVMVENGAVLSRNTAVNGNGGAIRNLGTLTITGATFTENKCEGTTNYLNGGAIYNTGKLIVKEKATFEKNTARSGGAIYNQTASGTLEISSGTFKENSTDKITTGSGGTGGAIYIGNQSGSVSINDAMFTGNSSRTNSSAAIDAQKTITLDSCNIYGNVSSGNSNPVYDIQLGNNVVLNLGGSTKAGVVYYPNTTARVCLQNSFAGSAILVPVPSGYTEGRQLVTFAEDVDQTTKEALVNRLIVGLVEDSQVVAGSYYIDMEGKLKAIPEGMVAKTGDTCYATLVDAFESVTTEEAVTIYLLQDIAFRGTIAIGAEGANKDITIANIAGKNIILTRAEKGSMLSVAKGSKLTIASNVGGAMTLDGNKDLATPHLIKNEGLFVLEIGASIQNAITEATTNGELYNGGALYNTGTAILKGTFNGCSAYNGGAVYNAAGAKMTVDGANFTENATDGGNGGAIRNLGELTVENAIFENNKAVGNNGGAVYTNTANFEAKNTIFRGNTASKSGGAIYAGGNKLTCIIKGSTFESNIAGDGTGGAIRSENILTIEGGSFTENSATKGGGAVDVSGDGKISGVTMHGNTVTASNDRGGGAICVASGKKLVLGGSNIYNNAAYEANGTIPACDIYNAGVASNLTLSEITADDDNEETTDQCFVYQSGKLWYVDSDGTSLVEAQ